MFRILWLAAAAAAVHAQRQCNCTAGYGGPDCGLVLTPCDSQPCANGGTCEEVTSSILGCADSYALLAGSSITRTSGTIHVIGNIGAVSFDGAGTFDDPYSSEVVPATAGEACLTQALADIGQVNPPSGLACTGDP